MPIVVGGLVPWGIAGLDRWASGGSWAGFVLVVLGVAIVASTVRSFFRHGRGTLAPWDPPRQLVTAGLFAYSRNPMYIGVLTAVAGWALFFLSPPVAGYLLLLALAFHVRVITYEEPWAAKTFSDAWPAYRDAVPRWLPRPWRRSLNDGSAPSPEPRATSDESRSKE